MSNDSQQLASSLSLIPLVETNLNSIEKLKLYNPEDATTVIVRGYYSPGDGGGGEFSWDPSSTAEANGGTVIASSVKPNGRWIRALQTKGTVTPEMFGAYGDGVRDDGPAINTALLALSVSGGGTLLLANNTTYNLASYSANGRSAINLQSKVNIHGSGFHSVLRIANGVHNIPECMGSDKSGCYFIYALYRVGSLEKADHNALNDVIYSDFTIDLNGQNNSCGGTCWAYNAALGADYGNNISVDRVNIINNPGSNSILFGRNVFPPTITNLRITNSNFEYNGDAINPAAYDHSTVWVTSENTVISGNTFNHGPWVNGAAIEIHGVNVVAKGNTIANYMNGANLANEEQSAPGGTSSYNPSYNLSFLDNNIYNAKFGVVIWGRKSSILGNVVVANNNICLSSISPAVGIDAASEVKTLGNNANLSITGNVIWTPGLTSSVPFPGIYLGAFYTINVANNTIRNTGGPAIWGNGEAFTGAVINVNNNVISNPGLSLDPSFKLGIWLPSAPAIVSILSIQGNSIAGSIDYGILGGIKAETGYITNNGISGALTPVHWTGPGVKF